MKAIRALLLATPLFLTACGGSDLVTDEEAAIFQDQVTDQVPEMRAYGDDLFKGIATNVCTLLKGENTGAADAVKVMDNYSKIPASMRGLVVGIAAGSTCPEFKNKIR